MCPRPHPCSAPSLAATQHSLVAPAQCRVVGLSRHVVHRLVRRRHWEVVAPGVYRICGSPLTWQSRAMAAALASGPEALVSHRSAATSGASTGSAHPAASRCSSGTADRGGASA